MVFTLVLVGAGLAAASLLFRRYLHGTFGVHDETKEQSVDGKIVVITGANTGLGSETAYEFAKRGAVVVMACRDQGKTSDAIKAIRGRTSRGELIFMKLDLNSLDSVRGFCKNLNERFSRIDILINNAGINIPLNHRKKTADGFEINLGVNHLGPFLLTNLLKEKLQAGAPSRVVMVASEISERGKLDLDDLMLEKVDPADIRRAYGTSKLANILFAQELSRRSKGTELRTYSVCPGLVRTGLMRDASFSWLMYIVWTVYVWFYSKSLPQGIQTILHCALSSDVADETGKIYRNCRPWVTKSDLRESQAKGLWAASEELVGLKNKGS